MSQFHMWRELHAERLAEASSAMMEVPGIDGLILGGSVARNQHWPLSDIDIIPIWQAGCVDDPAMQRVQASLVDWWAASGRAQTLDVSWIRFDTHEAARLTEGDTTTLSTLMSDPRWFHGIDKTTGGRALPGSSQLTRAFAEHINQLRFEPEVIRARVAHWGSIVEEHLSVAENTCDTDRAQATLALRTSARALRLVYLESWGERLGSMGREWTLWERLANKHNHRDLASALADIADTSTDHALTKTRLAPAWLQERIRLALLAREQVGENIDAATSARDQLAAFAVHVMRRWPDLRASWLNLPDPDLHRKLIELKHLCDQARILYAPHHTD